LAGVDSVPGGLKVYRGSAAAARHYVEADRGRADDYYLAEGSGVAERYLASGVDGVRRAEPLTGDAYEAWEPASKRSQAYRKADYAPTTEPFGLSKSSSTDRRRDHSLPNCIPLFPSHTTRRRTVRRAKSLAGWHSTRPLE
jgi:hypothetical protein